MAIEVIKIKDGLFVDLEDFYDKVIVPRNIKTYDIDPDSLSVDPNEIVVEE